MECHIEAHRRVILVPVTILAGQALSAAVELKSMKLAGIILPSNWTAAIISFQAGYDAPVGQTPTGGSPTIPDPFSELVDDTGTAVATSSLTVGTTGLYVGFGPTFSEKFTPVNFLKVRSGTSGAPTNQVNTVTLQLVTVVSFK